MYDRARGRQFLAIVFRLRGTLYALEQRGSATLLPWLQRYVPPSTAPGLPSWCLGLLNVRGTVQMVADLGALIGLGLTEPTDTSRLIFIEHGSAQLGLMVDQEIGVRMLRLDDATTPGGAPFVACEALLDDTCVSVLDGAGLVSRVAEELRAPSYLS